MRAAAIIAAAGSGTRLGRDMPKALVALAGTPLVVHAVRAFDFMPVIVVAPAESVAEMTAVLATAEMNAQVVAGGRDRQESVAAGLGALPDDVDVVLVHDAARPLVPREVIDRVLAALAAGNPAVVPGVPVADTLRMVTQAADGALSAGLIDRESVVAIQTPQGFTRGVLERAHRLADYDPAPVTDDASLAERLGVPVLIVDGDPRSLKITTAADLLAAEGLA